MSENGRQSDIFIVINDKSQGSTATYLSFDGLLHYTFIIQFASKRFFFNSESERSLFTMSEHNKYTYKLDNGRLPERNNHHSWPPMITEKNNH